MMTLKEAFRLTTGNIVYDISGRSLKVGDYTITFDDGKPINAYFKCTDTNDPTWCFTYQYNEIYQNFEDLCDEEKLFLKWIQNYSEEYDLDQIKTAYMAGFSQGYSMRQKYSAEEQLQK
jgi:hypothetical protein